MKRIRLDRLSSRTLAPASIRTTSNSIARIPRTIHARSSRLSPSTISSNHRTTRCQSTSALAQLEAYDERSPEHDVEVLPHFDRKPPPLPSPHPDRAARSAKLAALHARISLSSKIPPETLARALVDASADPHPRFNNANLAYVGASLLQYHTSEWLVTRYPRLPMAILFAAMNGYAGVPALHQIARAWGVEAAAAPGEEVDPGLLQFSAARPTVQMNQWGYVRAESKELQKYKWRRGMSSRVVYDDAFGQLVPGQPAPPRSDPDGAATAFEMGEDRNTKTLTVQDAGKSAHANFVRAVVGAVYLHCGRDTAKTFVRAYVLSRTLDLENLFEFRQPTRELARLCAREDFEAPVARLLSETGRLSRTPVFVVGIYSGADKLGEGTGASLDAARTAAAIHSLKSWYLYSPGAVNVPSDALTEDAAPWKPVYVDIGEIIS